MQDLWGHEMDLILPQRTTTPIPQPPSAPRPLTVLECHSYGHSWQRIGLGGQKRCTVCGITGYCPGCTPTAPRGAHPFHCTLHTLTPAPASLPQEEEERP